MRVRGDRQPGQQAMVELLRSGAYRTVPATQPLPVRPKVSHSAQLDQSSNLLLSYKGDTGQIIPPGFVRRGVRDGYLVSRPRTPSIPCL
jgi:hypothetical protein